MPAEPDDGAGRLDVDAAFAEIVAHWDDEGPGERTVPGAPADDARGGAEPGEHGAAAR
ncbi:hypothetical protein GTR00_21745, partial [Kineococcus sp. T90]|nr:hypothetical protein [Kineococcus indalonis]